VATKWSVGFMLNVTLFITSSIGATDLGLNPGYLGFLPLSVGEPDCSPKLRLRIFRFASDFFYRLLHPKTWSESSKTPESSFFSCSTFFGDLFFCSPTRDAAEDWCCAWYALLFSVLWAATNFPLFNFFLGSLPFITFVESLT